MAALFGMVIVLLIGIPLYWEGIKMGAEIIKKKRLKNENLNMEPNPSSSWKKFKDIFLLVLAMGIGSIFNSIGVQGITTIVFQLNPKDVSGLWIWILTILFLIGSWAASSTIASKEINPTNS